MSVGRPVVLSVGLLVTGAREWWPGGGRGIAADPVGRPVVLMHSRQRRVRRAWSDGRYAAWLGRLWLTTLVDLQSGQT